jgi:hypothetical protein
MGSSSQQLSYAVLIAAAVGCVVGVVRKRRRAMLLKHRLAMTQYGHDGNVQALMSPLEDLPSIRPTPRSLNAVRLCTQSRVTMMKETTGACACACPRMPVCVCWCVLVQCPLSACSESLS